MLSVTFQLADVHVKNKNALHGRVNWSVKIIGIRQRSFILIERF